MPTIVLVYLALIDVCLMLQVLYDGGDKIAGCCPEGVLSYNPRPPAACETSIASTAYSVSYVSRSAVDEGQRIVFFCFVSTFFDLLLPSSQP